MHPIIFDYFSKPERLYGMWGRMNDKFSLPFSLNCYDYLKYAENELKTVTNENLINALSNIGRAMFVQIESFLFCHNLRKHFNNAHKTNKEKINFLGDLGLISPDILKEINKVRNHIEHQFEIPSNNTVRNCFGIVKLFVSKLDHYIIDRKEQIMIYRDNLNEEVVISFKPKNYYTEKDNNNSDDADDKSSNGFKLPKPRPPLPEKEGELYLNGFIDDAKIENEVFSVKNSPDEYYFILSYFVNYNKLQNKSVNMLFNDIPYWRNYMKKSNSKNK